MLTKRLASKVSGIDTEGSQNKKLSSELIGKKYHMKTLLAGHKTAQSAVKKLDKSHENEAQP